MITLSSAKAAQIGLRLDQHRRQQT